VIESLFARVGFSPNDSQRQAIEHLHDPLFLVAGPCSGKTRVLVWRVVNLIVFHGVALESIFLCTFTEKAAKQLQNGLVSLLGLASEQTGKRCERTATGARLSPVSRELKFKPTLLTPDDETTTHLARFIEVLHLDESEVTA
jgi:ATP-dependent exoDNAse (exonuclease V) beta subunit